MTNASACHKDARTYRDASRLLLSQATTELAKGDLRQASEKGWGAAAQIVKAVAEQQGWEHDSHRLLFGAVSRLAVKTGHEDLKLLFHLANTLHVNFYDDLMDSGMVETALGSVESFVDRVEPFSEGWASNSAHQPSPSGGPT